MFDLGVAGRLDLLSLWVWVSLCSEASCRQCSQIQSIGFNQKGLIEMIMRSQMVGESLFLSLYLRSGRFFLKYTFGFLMNHIKERLCLKMMKNNNEHELRYTTKASPWVAVAVVAGRVFAKQLRWSLLLQAARPQRSSRDRQGLPTHFLEIQKYLEL